MAPGRDVKSESLEKSCMGVACAAGMEDGEEAAAKVELTKEERAQRRARRKRRRRSRQEARRAARRCPGGRARRRRRQRLRRKARRASRRTSRTLQKSQPAKPIRQSVPPAQSDSVRGEHDLVLRVNGENALTCTKKKHHQVKLKLDLKSRMPPTRAANQRRLSRYACSLRATWRALW